MIDVSDAWKTAHKGLLLPISEIEIEYNITEPGVQADASASATLEETFSAAENTVIELLSEEPKYAMLEHNQWVLDGSYTALPVVVPDASGFISRTLSNAYGVNGMVSGSVGKIEDGSCAITMAVVKLNVGNRFVGVEIGNNSVFLNLQGSGGIGRKGNCDVAGGGRGYVLQNGLEPFCVTLVYLKLHR